MSALHLAERASLRVGLDHDHLRRGRDDDLPGPVPVRTVAIWPSGTISCGRSGPVDRERQPLDIGGFGAARRASGGSAPRGSCRSGSTQSPGVDAGERRPQRLRDLADRHSHRSGQRRGRASTVELRLLRRGPRARRPPRRAPLRTSFTARSRELVSTVASGPRSCTWISLTRTAEAAGEDLDVRAADLRELLAQHLAEVILRQRCDRSSAPA